MHGIAADSAGNAFVVGRQYNGIHLDDILVMKLAAADGEILWSDLFGGADDQYDSGWSVVVGPDDHPVVTGITGNADGTANFLTRKLANSNGAEVWTRSIPGALNNVEQRAGWLAVCDDGDVVMANRTWTATTSYDVVVHRYDAVDGATVWTKQYNSSGTTADDPRNMLRDEAGDILVVGVRAGNYMVLKFAQTDGSLAWSAGYNGPPGWYDTADCVLEGPAGEVIVSGFSTGATTDWDVATVGFAPEDGAQLWAERYDAGDSLSDEGTCIAVGPIGDLYVVGYGYDIVTGSDLLTLRYSIDPPSAVPELTSGSGALLAAPNPFSDRISFRSLGEDRGMAGVAIYDAMGRQIATLGSERPTSSDAGSHLLTWDGCGADGRPVAPGVYWVRTTVDGRSESLSIVRAR